MKKNYTFQNQLHRLVKKSKLNYDVIVALLLCETLTIRTVTNDGDVHGAYLDVLDDLSYVGSVNGLNIAQYEEPQLH